MIFASFAFAVGLAALFVSMQNAAQGMLTRPPIKVIVREYRVVFAQRGWSFVMASIEQQHRIGFINLSVWRTVYTQERRFGEQPWGYSMRELHELPAHRVEQLAGKLVSDYLSKPGPSTALTSNPFAKDKARDNAVKASRVSNNRVQ